MFPDLQPQPEPTEVSFAAQSHSELSIDDFQVPANNLALEHIASQIIAMHIFNYLSSVRFN